MEVVDARVEGSLLAGLHHALVHELLRLAIHLLDAGRVNATVRDEVFQGHARYLASHGIEAREDDRLGSVVDDERHARDLLEGADVSSLTSDDASLQVVGGDVHGRDRDLSRLVGRAALYGGRHDLARGLVGLRTHPLLGVAQDLGLVLDGVCTHAVEDLLVGVLLGERRDALEFRLLRGVEAVDLVATLVERALHAGELALALVEHVVALVERLLTLQNAVLHALNLCLATLFFGLGLLLEGKDLFLGLEHCGLVHGACLALRPGRDALGLGPSILHLAFRFHYTRVALAV